MSDLSMIPTETSSQAPATGGWAQLKQQVQQIQQKQASTISSRAKWYFVDDNFEAKILDKTTMATLEASLAAGSTSVKYSIGNFKYDADLVSMTQCNVSNGRSRTLIRTDVAPTGTFLDDIGNSHCDMTHGELFYILKKYAGATDADLVNMTYLDALPYVKMAITSLCKKQSSTVVANSAQHPKPSVVSVSGIEWRTDMKDGTFIKFYDYLQDQLEAEYQSFKSSTTKMVHLWDFKTGQFSYQIAFTHDKVTQTNQDNHMSRNLVRVDLNDPKSVASARTIAPKSNVYRNPSYHDDDDDSGSDNTSDSGSDDDNDRMMDVVSRSTNFVPKDSSKYLTIISTSFLDGEVGKKAYVIDVANVSDTDLTLARSCHGQSLDTSPANFQKLMDLLSGLWRVYAVKYSTLQSISYNSCGLVDIIDHVDY